ncbi:MAG: cupredoxin domain-containing protein [Dehalococcoidia bacterium]
MVQRKLRTRWRPSSLAGAVIVVGAVAVACGGGSSTPTAPSPVGITPTPAPSAATEKPSTPASTTTATATPAAAAINFSAPSGIDGADAEFNYSAMVWQGYWLSRDHFGPLAMGSAMGIPFEPPMEMMQMAMQMVGGTATDQPFMPENLAPLQAVFRSGDTALTTDMTKLAPTDFAALRLNPASFEQVVGVEGQAQLMLKESQWARNFHDASHFGTPESDFGAQQRFMGMMVSMLAQMQGQYAMQMLMDPATGLYKDGDGALDYRGNWTLLQAFADIAGITGDETLRYYNPEVHGMFAGAAAGLFKALETRQPADAYEMAAAARGLSFLVWTSDDDAVKTAAREKAKSVGARLVALPASGTPAEHGAAIAGLLATAHLTGDTAVLGAAGAHLRALLDDFDPETGVYRSTTNYRVDDVAWVIGGLNSVVQVGPEALRAPAAAQLVAFYEATLNQSGMQLSAPPGKDGAMAAAFEKDLPSVVYYHGRNTPPPPMAGGEFGRLMLPASEVTIAGGTWTVTDFRFESAGGMHLANELNWLGPHLGSVPFPPFGGAQPPAAATPGAVSSSITVTAKNTAFDKGSLAVPAGQEVKLTLVNQDDAVPHNIHISGPGGVDEKTEIFAGKDGGSRELIFTLPAGDYTFVCDVHPNQMRGTVQAR